MPAFVDALVHTLIPRQLPKAVERQAGVLGDRTVGKVAADELAIAPSARMLAKARNLLSHVKDNEYEHIPDIEPRKGIFHADCSELIDYLAKKVSPDSLKDLPLDAGHPEPRAENYYDYFHGLSSSPSGKRWASVGKPSELAPGDVVAWKNEAYSPGNGSTGHVMLVSELPRPVRKDGQVLGYDVPIIDSTSHGHGPGDTRPTGKTGLGEGTIFLPTDATGAASGFSWTPSGTPAAEPPRPPALAFGRLLK